MKHSLLFCWFTVFLAGTGSLLGAPINSVISYQGQLGASGAPANGQYDFRFILYDAEIGGSQAGRVLTNAAVTVSNGLFTASLDFGPGVFNGTAYWLDLAVRTNGPGAFTPLVPRQPLAPAPYALYAPNAAVALAAQSVAGGAVGSSALQSNAVTADKIAAGAVVRSINGLTDAVTLSTWDRSGNVGTVAGVNFLGTLDAQPLDLKVNSARALRIEPTAGTPNLIGGHESNRVVKPAAGGTIGGGGSAEEGNIVSGDYGTVGGGLFNESGYYGFTGGGYFNYAGGDYAVAAGGFWNTAGRFAGTIGGGTDNIVTNGYGVIGGGATNVVGGWAATVSGGEQNFAYYDYATVAGGLYNWARGDSSAVGGGYDNTADGWASVVGGGSDNRCTNAYGAIAGGLSNWVGGFAAFIGSGEQNTADWDYAAVGGGFLNWSGGLASTVGGGDENWAIGDYSTVGGGAVNYAAGYAATVPGGLQAEARADYSFAAGAGAIATNVGAFVWADATLTNGVPAFLNSTNRNEFVARATGGVRFISGVTVGGAPNAGVILRPGQGAWSNLSDRNSKENFTPVDARKVLEQVAALPLATWNYKAQTPSIRHMGPTAQDFAAAFRLGDDDATICTVDTDGVALAAIQGLNELVREKEQRIRALEQRLADLEKRLASSPSPSSEGR
jgi:trimeric autotransporter adhesin